MAHAWKACWVQALGGSNPPSSANLCPVTDVQRGVTVTSSDPQRSRRTAVRRHRRERQVLVFGVLVLVIAAVSFVFYGVYRGTVPGPFDRAFVTPEAAYTTDVTLVCPPSGSFPLAPSEVAVRVLNATDEPGLAGRTMNDLEGRGFVALGSTNFAREYTATARILFGETGVQKAYTVALQFPEAELVLDARTNATVDVILGDAFVALREQTAPELNAEAPLSANGPCLPISQVDPEPAPRIYPEDPLASPEPSPSSEPTTEPDGE
jgi:hypothetical protein